MEKVNQKITHRYQVVKKIGMGAYGQVWKAKDKLNKNRNIAIKRIYDAFRNQTDAQRTYREVCYHSMLKHPNIVKSLSIHQFQDDRDIYLTLQYMQMDLATFLKRNTLTQTHKLYIFYQVINAISYLHSCDLIHRDLKPSNILLNKNCEAKICDFGLIRSIYRNDNSQPLEMTQNVATKFYQAPEILLGSKYYGKAIDIWSLGCILAEMFIGKTLFTGSSAIDFLQSIMQICGKPSQQDLNVVTQSQTSREIVEQMANPDNVSIQSILNCSNKLLIDLLVKMLEFNPKKRITIEQVKLHPLFKKFKNTVHEVQTNKPIIIPYDKKQPLDIKCYQDLIKKYAQPIQSQQLTISEQIADNLENGLQTSRKSNNNYRFTNNAKMAKNLKQGCPLLFFPTRIGVSKSPQKPENQHSKRQKDVGYALSSLNSTQNSSWSKKNMQSQIISPQIFLKQIKQDNYMFNSVTSFTNYKRKQQLTFSPFIQYRNIHSKKYKQSKNISFEIRHRKSEQ